MSNNCNAAISYACFTNMYCYDWKSDIMSSISYHDISYMGAHANEGNQSQLRVFLSLKHFIAISSFIYHCNTLYTY